MWIEFIAPLAYVLVFVFILLRAPFFRLEGIPRYWPVAAFLLKVVAGFVFYLAYTRYYTDPTESDALRYYKDAELIRSYWDKDREVFLAVMMGETPPEERYTALTDQLIAWSSGYRYGLSNDCSTIIRINVLVGFIGCGSYHVHAIIMTFLSFIGLTGIFKAFESIFSARKKILFFGAYLLPGVLFWSSSVLKEAPLFLSIGLMVWIMHLFDARRMQLWHLLIFIPMFILAIYIKVYALVSFLPAIMFLIVMRYTGAKWRMVKFVFLHLLCFLVAEQGHLFLRGGDFSYVLHKKQTDFYNVAYYRDAGSVVDIPPVTSAQDLVIHYPQAFFLTYFRPHLFEANSLAMFVFALESTCYLLIFLLPFFFFHRPEEASRNLLLCSLSFVLIFAVILGNCVPVLGSMVRYKVIAMPFFVLVCFAFTRWETLESVWRKFFPGGK